MKKNIISVAILYLYIFTVSGVFAEQTWVKPDAELEKRPGAEFVITQEMKTSVLELSTITIFEVKRILNCDELQAQAVIDVLIKGGDILTYEQRYAQIYSGAPAVSDLVNINTAGFDELITLNGIGEVSARRIINYRDENGPFQRKEDIMDVYRIGEYIYNKIKDHITI